jgi:SOS-response transcriptional repressor LexA
MREDNRKLKVFLCHSKDDKFKVREFYHRLIASGIDAWLDEEKIVPGQDWDFEIQKAIRGADTVVVFLSNDSITKEGYIQKEIRLALDIADEKPEGTIFLIPARLENCSVPSRISRFQWVDLFDENGYLKLKESLKLRMDDLNIRFSSIEVLPTTSEDKISIPVKVSIPIQIRIPILGPIAVGLPLPDLQPGTTFITENEADAVDIARSLLPSKEKGDDLYALEVRGNSMIDAMINDGDIVIMKPVNEARNGELVAIWLPDENAATLKYFFKEKNRYRLQPANPTMKAIYIRKDQRLEIKGKVVMVIRKNSE